MGRVLLTGGSGFIALHVLSVLLDHGHSVVATVRSEDKANKIRALYPKASKADLDFVLVPDIAVEGAFDKAVISDPPFDYVVHTASPFTYNITNIQTELLDPAIIGTTGILKSIKASAPSVKRVIITSSFAAIIDSAKLTQKGYVFSEKDWNPVTHEQALETTSAGYRASKTFAERAAWEFVEKEKPAFDLATLCPPMVFGPVVPSMQSLTLLNTSNERVLNIIQGKMKDEVPVSSIAIWVDVRDLALAHVKAIETPEAGGKRFFVTAGYFSNRETVEIVREAFPELKDKLPPKGSTGGEMPEAVHGFDNSRTKTVLGINFRSLKDCVVPLVKSLQEMGA